MSFRNIAIIAHVDHGKTTLVDTVLRQCHAFAAHEAVADRVMDSMDLERERGITIASKNTAAWYGETKINILDTPGHADFGGEVERVLGMVEGAVLLVDAAEGPLPQTRFVLRKAMAQGLKIVVVINKIDRQDARAQEVLNLVYDLFIDLGADDHHLDFPVLYTIAREGKAWTELPADPSEPADLKPLLDAIVATIPAPPATDGDAGRMMITNLDYDSYVGRVAIGRLREGRIKRGDTITWFGLKETKKVRIQLLYTWRGLRRHEVDVAEPGDVVGVAGIEGITVGDSVCCGEAPEALPRVTVDEPTIGMLFTINTSPLSGRDGKFLTGRQIEARLDRELLTNVSLRKEDGGAADAFKIVGRGELQLAILIEQMRREGFELSVSRPEVVRREVDGVMQEPYEEATLDIPDAFVGTITERMASRKGQLLDMNQDGSGRTRIVYRIPSRGLIGFRGEFLTATRGEGVLNTTFDGWDEDAGRILGRNNGSMIADRTGKATTYALFNLQPRGVMFVEHGTEVYEGMIIGEHARENDLNVDVTREKKLTNVRSAGADEKQILVPPRKITLETAMEFIEDDELIEITPSAIRMRKKVLAGNQRSVRRNKEDET